MIISYDQSKLMVFPIFRFSTRLVCNPDQVLHLIDYSKTQLQYLLVLILEWYFLISGYYIGMLIPAAIMGVLVIIYGLATLSDYEPA